MTSVATGTPAVAGRGTGNATSITIPLTVTVSLGGAAQSARAATRPRTLSGSAQPDDTR